MPLQENLKWWQGRLNRRGLFKTGAAGAVVLLAGVEIYNRSYKESLQVRVLPRITPLISGSTPFDLTLDLPQRVRYVISVLSLDPKTLGDKRLERFPVELSCIKLIFLW